MYPGQVAQYPFIRLTFYDLQMPFTLGIVFAIAIIMKSTGYILMMIVLSVNVQTFASDTGKQEISWFKKTFLSLSWSEVIEVVRSPQEVARRVHTQVDYKADDVDLMKSGADTWNDKTGDCEDFAECIVEICKAKDFEAWIEVMFEEGNGNAHSVAMGRWEGRLWISSNGSYQTVDSKEEAKRIVARDLGWNKKQTHSVALDEYQKDPGIVIASAPKGIAK